MIAPAKDALEAEHQGSNHRSHCEKGLDPDSRFPPRLRERRQKSGNIHYYYDHGGKPRKETPLGSDYVMAIRKWADLEAVETPKAAAITFRQVAERYMREILPGKATRTQSDNLKELEKLYGFFDNPPAPLDNIRPIHIRQYLDWRKSAPVRANREKALFSHIWNCARDLGYTDLPNPCAGIKGNRESGRDVYVEDDVYKAVLAAADQPLRDAMDIAYLTGQRPADALAITEGDIRDGVLQIQQAKTGTKLRISVIGELADVVQRIRDRKSTLKVRALRHIVNEQGRPLTACALRSRFDKARLAAIAAVPSLADAIKKFQFRDLRAKAATDKAESAGDIRQAQKQLGHSSVAMTEQYVRNRKGDLSDPTR